MSIFQKIKDEILRKSFHLLLLLIPTFYYNFGRLYTVLLALAAVLTIVPLDKYRHKDEKINKIFVKIFGKIMRQKEISEGKMTGASAVAISALITFLVFKPLIAFSAFCILAVSDTFAALIGKSISSKKFFEKSQAGSTAFYISGAITIMFCGYLYRADLSFYFFALFALLITTIIEARPSLFEYDDNITIPISFAMVMTVFDIIWHFRF